jgi:hypothetical protein
LEKHPDTFATWLETEGIGLKGGAAKHDEV